MARAKDGPTPFDADAYDFSLLPDYDDDFVNEDDFAEFAKALAAGDVPVSSDNATSTTERGSLFITALNDWRPIHQRARRNPRRRRRRPPNRGTDETREGYVYTLLKWPLLTMVMAWIILLGLLYLLTRLYIFLYEHLVTMRGKRNQLRNTMRSALTYNDWVAAAKDMDRYLGNDSWKETDEYAYYNSKTVRTVWEQLRRLRAELENSKSDPKNGAKAQIAEDLRTLVEGSVKDNFVGVENPHLYSETYYGTKDLVQDFVDEVEMSLQALSKTSQLSGEEKKHMYQHLYTNYGRTALCLSGGATFAYYHFGLAKALLEADVLPKVITGTSGGALVAALLATRTDDELKKLLVPALANRIDACRDPITTWLPRWWRTGARFDSIDWAKRCAWFCHGSLTFREAYERTGRILNVTCIPSEPSSPTLLANYLTAPDCVIWSAVLASAAVPGILNPVVLMRKSRSGKLVPYSFGNRWKDGSLRTDIPLKALNTHFNVNFSIVSQVNPHINLFFFSSRGAVGRPVTHRRGRGWRGGFLGSAVEQYLKLDLTKWLKVLRHLELLPRAFGQDWSEIWLQRFSGTITIWPRVSFPSDFVNILSDPPPERLARMIHVGQQSGFPKLKFIRNRMKVERRIEEGWASASGDAGGATRNGLVEKIGRGTSQMPSSFSEEDLQALIKEVRQQNGKGRPTLEIDANAAAHAREDSPSLSKRLTGWLTRSPSRPQNGDGEDVNDDGRRGRQREVRRSSIISELGRQSRVFFDDDIDDLISANASEEDEGSLRTSADEWDGEEYGKRTL